jgi:hypothetical protein
MGPNDATRRLGPGMFLFSLSILLLLIYNIDLYDHHDTIRRPTRATQADEDQREPTAASRDGPKRCDTSFGPRYVFVFFIYSFTVDSYTDHHDHHGNHQKANAGQRRPTTATQANDGQRERTQANDSQPMPTTANEGQHRPMIAHERTQQ